MYIHGAARLFLQTYMQTYNTCACISTIYASYTTPQHADNDSVMSPYYSGRDHQVKRINHCHAHTTPLFS
jgi:hypothetical protein